jgi:hypothetical protein
MITTGLCLTDEGVWRGLREGETCFVVRYGVDGSPPAQVGGEFDDIHDVLVSGGECYVVATGSNEIVMLDLGGRLRSSWKFAGDGDAWHLNCVSTFGDRIVYSAFGEFREHRGYKGNSRHAGFVRDLATGRDILTGLSQPHTPSEIEEGLLVCNSETREIILFDPQTDSIVRRRQFDGYTRGIAVTSEFIYLGLSVSRNIERSEMKTPAAALVKLDRRTWNEIERCVLPFAEVYDIRIAPSAGFLESIARSAQNVPTGAGHVHAHGAGDASQSDTE